MVRGNLTMTKSRVGRSLLAMLGTASLVAFAALGLGQVQGVGARSRAGGKRAEASRLVAAQASRAASVLAGAAALVPVLCSSEEAHRRGTILALAAHGRWRASCSADASLYQDMRAMAPNRAALDRMLLSYFGVGGYAGLRAIGVPPGLALDVEAQWRNLHGA